MASDSSRVRKEFIRTSGSSTPYSVRSARVCRAMMSRKDSPSLTTSADFGPVMPIEVPSPPLSLTIATWRSAAAIAASVGA